MKNRTCITIQPKQFPHSSFSFEERKKITPFLREIEAFEMKPFLFESHKTVQEIQSILKKYNFLLKKD